VYLAEEVNPWLINDTTCPRDSHNKKDDHCPHVSAEELA